MGAAGAAVMIIRRQGVTGALLTLFGSRLLNGKCNEKEINIAYSYVIFEKGAVIFNTGCRGGRMHQDKWKSLPTPFTIFNNI